MSVSSILKLKDKHPNLSNNEIYREVFHRLMGVPENICDISWIAIDKYFQHFCHNNINNTVGKKLSLYNIKSAGPSGAIGKIST